MEIQQLRYFVTTAEELHFQRAAARLSIAQPSLTEQIQRLEEELSVRLLDRDSHHVALTSAGHAFLASARRTLRSARSAAEGAVREGQVAARADAHAGHLRVGYLCSVAQELLPAALRATRAAHPAVAITVGEAWSGQQIASLLTEEIDAGFVFGSDQPRRLVLLPVLRQSMTVLLPRGHVLAGEPALRLCDLVQYPLVLFSRPLSPVLHDRLCWLAAEAGVALDVRHTVTEASAAQLLAEAGHGLAVVTSARALEMGSPGLVHRPLVSSEGGSSPAGPVFLAWRRGDRSRPLRTFVRAVRGARERSVRPAPASVEGREWNCVN